jgi:superfamily II DNA or RNA helicase
MSLKDLKLKPVYHSDSTDILFEFYIPVLSVGVKYDRIAGYFCSNALAIAAKGVAGLINNGGKVRLIANIVLSEEDQEAIKEAIEKREKEILLEIQNLEDELQDNHIKVLGWMIQKGILEIKIAVVRKGIEHQKVGIIEDNKGERISFTGSENETVGGWLNNNERFHVFCSWKEGDSEHLFYDIEDFNLLWNDHGQRVRVYSVSDAFIKGLIKKAPNDNEEFKRITKDIYKDILIDRSKRELRVLKEVAPGEIKLRDYQTEAVQNWINKGCVGIFEMATGTGKTFTALGCIKELNKDITELVVVISCPYNHLVQQWAEDVDEFGLGFETVLASSINTDWKSCLNDKVYDIKNKILSKLIIFVTHDTIASPDFISILHKIKLPIFLICDEVHGIGSEQRCTALISDLYRYRLGLSATPSRWFDDEGTKIISDFFGGTVYEFPLKKAISTIDPVTGKPFLVRYEYHPIFIELTDFELQEYEEQTKKLAKLYFVSNNPDEKGELFNLLCIKRQKIIKNSRGKYESFKALIQKLYPLKHCLVYVSPEQKDEIQGILSHLNIKQHQFTNEEGVKPDDRFSGMSEREFLLKEFAKGSYDILVAMKCLDEGVDIRQARIAIILASSGNPREYIQRRGRVLRPHPNKDKALIYDFLVVPCLSKIGLRELYDLEMRILKKEMLRYNEFADAADNRVECLKNLFELNKKVFG